MGASGNSEEPGRTREVKKTKNNEKKTREDAQQERKLAIAERAESRMRTACLSSKVEADNIGFKFPMPWTSAEALVNERNLHGLTGSKLTLLSRVASVADATGRRFRSSYSQRDCIKLKCPFPKCGYFARISFRLHGELAII